MLQGDFRSQKHLSFDSTVNPATPTFRPFIDSPQGVPPPQEEDWNDSSFSSSISLLENDADVQIHQIKDINKEIRRTATLAIKKFKNASKGLLSASRMETTCGSLLVSELENMRKNLNEAADLYKERKKSESLSLKFMNSNDGMDMEMILNKIQEIQKEIDDASEKLRNSELMINKTEESNQLLENRIKKIEETVYSVIESHELEKVSGPNCLCKLF